MNAGTSPDHALCKEKSMSAPFLTNLSQVSMKESQKSRRLLAIDLLRGLTLLFMIIVNNNGNDQQAYSVLRHASWNGFTPTDLVFPTFLFLVGLTTVLSTAKRLEEGRSKTSLILHVVYRSIILCLLGLVVNSFPYFHLATMRFYGVLPRIALCYLIVATFYIVSPDWRSKVVVLIAVLVGYWILMRIVPVPGFGIPGRDIPLLDSNGNLTAWMDRRIFSAAHLYERTRDPEGLLSTIPALGTVLIGLLTGFWLRTGRTQVQKVWGILTAGIGCVLLGSLWNYSFPINKKLWTSSFVLFAAGWSLLLLAFLCWFIDLRRMRTGKQPAAKNPPFDTLLLVFGTNAIFSYVLSELLASTLASIHLQSGLNLVEWAYQTIHLGGHDAAFASLLYSLAYTGLCWLIVYFLLYKRRIFLKI
ncbi:MAG: heparan-alpha-glucosaminide N-acetyltransferase domain-containing protein [Terracidiphilus sp.]|nr:heparan-alpha-glucosaminide N-acetyltransferase domain-containing protein [Terracidiphilus sp.]